MTLIRVHLLLSLLLLAMAAAAQQGQSGNSMGNMPGMDMSKMEPDSSQADLGQTTEAMTMKHMDMGPHMKMTELRPANAADSARAAQIASTLRSAIEKYKDVRVAEADGYKEHNPGTKAPMRHFTNIQNAMKARSSFDATLPTSLLYERHGSDYKLIGAMYTAPRRLNENDLDQRVPLSVAQWHEHINLCMPPKGRGHGREMMGPNARFGFGGSISTEAECTAAGGTFHPIIFSWMVHVYPWEKTQEEVWSAERGHGPGHKD